MSALVIHDTQSAWLVAGSASPAPAQVLASGLDTPAPGVRANHVRVSQAGARVGVNLEFVPAAPLDLSRFDELRLWVRGDQLADASAEHPFFLELQYLDDTPAPADRHTWLLPVPQPGVWTQLRIGIEGERRRAVNRFILRIFGSREIRLSFAELLAVRLDLLNDAEDALRSYLEQQVALPDLSNIPLAAPASVGDNSILVPLTRGFGRGNQILLRGGGTGDEQHILQTIDHNDTQRTTRLRFADGERLRGAAPIDRATVSLQVPILAASAGTPRANPAVFLSLLAAQPDLSRSPMAAQQDSYRERGGRRFCSVRRAGQAYILTFQLTASPTDWVEQDTLLAATLQSLQRASDMGLLRQNGMPARMEFVFVPAPTNRSEPSRIVLTYFSYAETERRVELPLVQQITIDADLRAEDGGSAS